MSAKSISEADGKAIVNYHLTRAPVIKPSPLPKPTTHNPPPRLASLYFPEDEDVNTVSPTLGFIIKTIDFQGYPEAKACQWNAS